MSLLDFQRLTNKPATVEGVRQWFEEMGYEQPLRLLDRGCQDAEAFRMWAACADYRESLSAAPAPTTTSSSTTAGSSDHGITITLQYNASAVPELKQQVAARTISHEPLKQPALDAPRRVFATSGAFLDRLSHFTLGHFPPSKALAYLQSRASAGVATAVVSTCTCLCAGGPGCTCCNDADSSPFAVCDCVQLETQYGAHGSFAQHMACCVAPWSKPFEHACRLQREGNLALDMYDEAFNLSVLQYLMTGQAV